MKRNLSTPLPSPEPEGPGLREQNRLDKLQRIKAAARDRFTEVGYDAATMRDIAAHARVGLGTLFNYAGDKRDLVFLAIIDDIEGLTRRAAAAGVPGAPLLDQLEDYFAHFYREFFRSIPIARIFLSELTFYTDGKIARQFVDNRLRILDSLEALVSAAQHDGRIGSAEAASTIARSIYFIYAGAVRWWIAAEQPAAESGVAQLRTQLAVLVQGLDARPAPRAT